MGDDVDRLGQAHDRIADELARSVPRDLAAAVDVDDRRAVGRALVPRGAGAGRVDRLVLEQQQRVGARRPSTTSAWMRRCSAHPSRYGT